MKNHTTQKWVGDWANKYDAMLGKFRRHHRLLDLVVRLSGVKKGNHVLDIGCGTGLLSLKFLKRADCQVTAVDSSSDMLCLFQNKIDTLGWQPRVRYAQQDARRLHFRRESFDIAAATVSLHHVENKLPMLKNIRTLLKSDGRLVIGEVDVDTSGDPADPKRLAKIMDFLKDEIILALRENGLVGLDRMYDSGKRHILNQGEYCVRLRQWKSLCRQAGFQRASIHPVPSFRWFKVLVAVK